jgi:two-component system OmpR family response regulator
VGLPGQDGFDLLAGLRQAGQWAPVIMLTARDGVPDRVRGLDLGADDYLTKPFAFAELLARLRATARRGRAARPVVLRCGDLALDPARREVRRAGAAVDLTAKEFAILECFMRRPGQVLSRSQLIEQVVGLRLLRRLEPRRRLRG